MCSPCTHIHVCTCTCVHKAPITRTPAHMYLPEHTYIHTWTLRPRLRKGRWKASLCSYSHKNPERWYFKCQEKDQRILNKYSSRKEWSPVCRMYNTALFLMASIRSFYLLRFSSFSKVIINCLESQNSYKVCNKESSPFFTPFYLLEFPWLPASF